MEINNNYGVKIRVEKKQNGLVVAQVLDKDGDLIQGQIGGTFDYHVDELSTITVKFFVQDVEFVEST